MFSLKAQEKPLPPPKLTVIDPLLTSDLKLEAAEGILLGDDCYWNPASLPNGHLVAIGGSGSGKTQTLKAIAYSLRQDYPDIQLFMIDFHGDQGIDGETCYPLHMASDYGINPLIINLDPEGGGPNLQAITVTTIFKKMLILGVNQEATLLKTIKNCYAEQGIQQNNPDTWTQNPPDFSHIQEALEESGNSDAQKLLLKLNKTFEYGIFSRPQTQFSDQHIRIDVSKLPPEIGAAAAESLCTQMMNNHRLDGETSEKMPKTYLFIDEAKELKKSPACDRIIADGRKYGLGLILASQSERHLSSDVIGNSSTKIVLPVDQTEVRGVARKFRFSEKKLEALEELTALCRFGTKARYVEIYPYYQRIK
jgi:hypothetical protein